MLYNLQQPNKKLDDNDYFKLLNILSVNENLVKNSDAKTAMRKNNGTYSRKRVTPQKQLKTQSKAQTNKRYTPEKLEQNSDNIFTDGKEGFETTKEDSETEERRVGTLSHSECKFLESKYTSGSAAYGSVKNLQKSTNLKPRKVIKILEGKNSHTKHQDIRKTFHRLKVIAYSIKEIWSLDLAHVDKLAPYNPDVKYHLFAVDCLSRYLRAEPLRSNYATVTAEGFKRMIQNKQPQKVWVDAGSEFKGSFKTLREKSRSEFAKLF